MAEHILVFHIARAEYNDLYRILTEFIHHIVHKVEAFLVCQTGNHTDHHNFRVFLQSKLLLEAGLVDRLVFAEVADIEILCDPVVCLRIPVVIIQSVHDAAQIIGACGHQSVKSLAVERGFDLFRVAVAYGRYFIRIDNAALQKVGVLVCFHLIRDKIVLRQPGDASDCLRVPYALKLQVMYRHNGLDPAVVFSEIAEIIKIYRDQSGLPVVAVDQIRPESDHGKDAEDCF